MAGYGAHLHLPDREHVRAHAAEARTPATVKAGAEPRAGPRADDADLAGGTNELWTRLATRASEEAQPLDGSVRERMEVRFGESFGNVRIHNTPVAGESARSIHARAYTLGDDLVFAPGQFAPDTPIGDKLLEHELGHVVEQRHGAPRGVYRAPDDSAGDIQGLGPIREPRQFKVDPSLGVLSLGLSTLDGFDFNGAGLTAKHDAEIVDVAAKVIMLLAKMPTGRITVTGHTDLVGGEDSNVRLGLRRAEAVRAALGKAGVPESAISAASEGSHNPVVNTKGQEPRNRRVEVRFEGDLLVPGMTPSRLTPPAGLSSDRPGAFDFTLHPDPLSPPASETPFAQPPASPKPEPKGSEGPAKPGSAGDVLDAVTKVPEVKRLIDQAKEGGLGDLGKLSPGEKVAVGVVTVPLVTGALAGIWSDPSGRKALLDFADGKEIPVPGVPWLKLKPITKGGAAGGMLQIDVLKIVPGLK